MPRVHSGRPAAAVPTPRAGMRPLRVAEGLEGVLSVDPLELDFFPVELVHGSPCGFACSVENVGASRSELMLL